MKQLKRGDVVIKDPNYIFPKSQYSVITRFNAEKGVITFYRHYIRLNTGEEIEISSEHYFTLHGVHDGTLRIEYSPNTMTAVRLSSHN